MRVCMRVFSTFMSWSNKNKSCIRIDKRGFEWQFSQLSCPGEITRTRVGYESWQARVGMSVFSTLVLWSNEDKSCTLVESTNESFCESCLTLNDRKSWWEFVGSRLELTYMSWLYDNKIVWELMKIDKPEFSWQFSQLSCPGQMRTRFAW